MSSSNLLDLSKCLWYVFNCHDCIKVDYNLLSNIKDLMANRRPVGKTGPGLKKKIERPGLT